MKLFNKYKFSDKSQALGGLISTAMGILSLLSFGYGVYLSFKAAGERGEGFRHPRRGEGDRLGQPDPLLRHAAVHDGQGSQNRC